MAKKALFVTLLIGSALAAGSAQAAMTLSRPLPSLPLSSPASAPHQTLTAGAPSYLTTHGLNGTCRSASASGC